MTPAAFLKLALSLPEVVEGRHQGGADLRVGGRIFATPADRPGGTAVLKLMADQQQLLCEAEPAIFRPVPGRYGAGGWTRIVVAKADKATAESALWMAWRNTAPAKLQRALAR